MPHALTQRWPFGGWVAIVLDHFSRDVVARGVFDKQPTGDDITALLDRAVREATAVPKYIVTDQGVQFQSEYRAWCKAHGVRPRFGALGQHGSIAVIERFIRSMKDECFRIIVMPVSLVRIERELDAYLLWYRQHRPHQGVGGRTPLERLLMRQGDAVSDARTKRQRAPPRRPKRPLRLVVSYVHDRKHLPVIELKRAA